MIQLAKEDAQLAKEIEEQKEAEELMVRLAVAEEQQKQRETEEVAKQLEEAQKLQVRRKFFLNCMVMIQLAFEGNDQGHSHGFYGSRNLINVTAVNLHIFI